MTALLIYDEISILSLPEPADNPLPIRNPFSQTDIRSRIVLNIKYFIAISGNTRRNND